jgi:antitoxin ParD1/3/4
MAQGINVRFAGALQHFIQQRVGESGIYSSSSEYIRDLVRRDYEREEHRKMLWLRDELKDGAIADESHFLPLEVGALLKKAKSNRKLRAS